MQQVETESTFLSNVAGLPGVEGTRFEWFLLNKGALFGQDERSEFQVVARRDLDRYFKNCVAEMPSFHSQSVFAAW